MKKLFAYLKLIPPIFLLGSLVFALIYLLTGAKMNNAFFWNATRNGLLTSLIWVANNIISQEVKISWIDFPLRRLLVTLLLTVVITLLVTLFVDMVYVLIVIGKLPNRLFYFDSSFYILVLVITFFISLFLHGRSFLMSYKKAIVEQEELKRTSLASRYESLQNQVNPHFLFNSLNVLSSLVYKDADLSAKFIEQLAEVYRYVLESQDREVVALAEEKKMLEAYLFLLEIRFGEQLRVSVDLPTEAEDALPPLVVQMLVENAVKHNIASRRKPLQLSIFRAGAMLCVRNNLQLKQQVHTSLGVGLKNIRERYALLSQKNIEIIENEETYEVRLPILKLTEYATADR
jgi:sensor histidine kinase YesM